jgi:hypothetical protein
MGQPLQLIDIAAVKFKAVIHYLGAPSIIRTATGFSVEQLTADIGVINFFSIGILELYQTAFCTAITECFPLVIVHFRKRLGVPPGLTGH